MDKIRVLIVTNDKLARKSLYEMLCRHGYEADIADSAEEALPRLQERLYHLVLADMDGTPDIELLKEIKEKSYPAEIVILASYGNLESTLDTLKIGAFDHLIRPVEDKKIISTIEKALAAKPLIKTAPSFIKKLLHKEELYFGLVGKNAGMKEIYSIVDRISNSKATILLRGESGTGKRLIACAIHNADKKRRDKPFVEISCGALPREIIESELFGHTKGAFTSAINDRKGRFELAHGGTILLDDIDSFSLDLQVKLLRVLQHKEFERVGDHKTISVDVRIIVATNQDLEKAVAEKKFREDLYYRLNVISINIPPLRKRKDDLPLLVDHFMNLYSKENHKKINAVSQETLAILMNYDWPGNIRELENIIERAVILDTDSIVGKDDLPEILLASASAPNTNDASSLKHALKEPEKVFILQVLKEVGWNKKKAARKLGVNRTTLYNKLRKYNLISEPNAGSNENKAS
ncbi:MAG: sigma-54-dependent Fis family transcriptional regulator [Candidatus Omnitrophica bacterium]|nr:sigma-54-dependent Fis family transcriptional regulator [Candidatus Omnitrophota bacterium]